MIKDLSDLEAWCAQIPGLAKVDGNSWALERADKVSYPEDDLAILADLESKSYWFNHRNNIIAAVVRRFPPTGPIFDIGGGNGYVAVALSAAGFPTVVVEPDRSGVATAQKRGLTTILAAFQNLEVPNESIAAVGLFDVLEHIEDEATALRSLQTVLQPGGMAYVAVPAYNFLWSEEDVHAGHFRRYSTSSLSAALRRAGLSPVFGTHFFRALVPAVLAFRCIPHRLRLGGRDRLTAAGEHRLPTGLLGTVLERSFAGELKAVQEARAVPFGSSVLIAARKDG